jgi:hypothetical protein
MSPRFVPLVALALAAATPACVIDPADGKMLDSYDQQITVQGLYNAPAQAITVEAFDFVNNAWLPVGSATSGAAPTVAANTFGNNPNLYYYATQVRVGTTPQELAARWAGNHAKLRVRAGNFFLYGSETTGPDGTPRGVPCVVNTSKPGADFYNTAYNCGFDDTEIDLYVDVIF